MNKKLILIPALMLPLMSCSSGSQSGPRSQSAEPTEEQSYFNPQAAALLRDLSNSVADNPLPLSHERLVIDAHFKQNMVQAGKWTAIIIGGSAVVYFSAGTLGPWVGGLVGGLEGLSGAAATSYGLAWLGGGSLASGGFGMVGGTIVVSSIAGLIAEEAIAVGFDILAEESDDYAKVKEAVQNGRKLGEDAYYQEALIHLRRILEAEEDNERIQEIRYQYALVLYDWARSDHVTEPSQKSWLLEQAESALKRITTSDGGSLAYMLLGDLALERGLYGLKFEDAIEYYNKAIRNEPSNHQVYMRLCNVYRLMDEHSKALLALKRFDQDKYDFYGDGEVQFLLYEGSILYLQGKIDEAIRVYKRAHDEGGGVRASRVLSDLFLERIDTVTGPAREGSYDECWKYTKEMVDYIIAADQELFSNSQEGEKWERTPHQKGAFLISNRNYFNRLLSLAEYYSQADPTNYRIKEAGNEAYNPYVDSTGYLNHLENGLNSEIVKRFKSAVEAYNADKFFDITLSAPSVR